MSGNMMAFRIVHRNTRNLSGPVSIFSMKMCLLQYRGQFLKQNQLATMMPCLSTHNEYTITMIPILQSEILSAFLLVTGSPLMGHAGAQQLGLKSNYLPGIHSFLMSKIIFMYQTNTSIIAIVKPMAIRFNQKHGVQ